MRRMQWLELSFQLAEALSAAIPDRAIRTRLDLIGSGRCLPRRHGMDDRSSLSQRFRYA